MTDRMFTKRRLKVLIALCVFVLVSLRLSPFWAPDISISSTIAPADPAISTESSSVHKPPPAPIKQDAPPAAPIVPAEPAQPSLFSSSSTTEDSKPTAISVSTSASSSSSKPEATDASVPVSLSPNAPTTPEHEASGKENEKELDVVIVVKTGATEASRRLPHQLVSFLAGKEDVYVFSDMEQWIGNVHIHDSLDETVEEATFNNTDFKLYFDQKQHILEGQDIGQLSNRAGESWALDKYKNIHTAQKAWKLKPNKSWYFFIDVDTYVVWPSMISYLKQFDPSKKHYLGAAVPGEFGQFAHGGSGYALSRAAMEVINGQDAKKIAYEFDVGARNNCCGDIQMSKPLYQNNINLTDAHPMINGDAPNNYRHGPRLWCKPLITMHHIGAEQMNDIWQFERSRKSPKLPLLFEELWIAYIEPKLPARRSDWNELSEDVKRITMQAEREDWDNFSEDVIFEPPKEEEGKVEAMWHKVNPKPAPTGPFESIDKCVRACKEMPECFQYTYSQQRCALQKSFRFGQKRWPDGGKTWKSGWDLDKIKKFKDENSPCKAVDYTTYHQ